MMTDIIERATASAYNFPHDARVIVDLLIAELKSARAKGAS